MKMKVTEMFHATSLIWFYEKGGSLTVMFVARKEAYLLLTYFSFR